MIREIWERLTEKQFLSMRNRTNDEINWKINISPLALWGSIVTLLILIFAVMLILMAYTSILDVLPGYRTKAERLNEELTQNIMRLNDIERNMEDIRAYNEAVATIMGGSTPTLHSTVLTDTIRYDKSRILPTRADSLLRDLLESNTSEYSLSNTKPLRSEAAMFSAPMRGTITRNFDAPESSFDIAIMPMDMNYSVMAVENGSVISVERQSEGLTSITIQHNGGYISIYKNLAEALVRKGQTVQSGSVIGRIGDDNGDLESTGAELGFELWRDGTAQDPERYILF